MTTWNEDAKRLGVIPDRCPSGCEDGKIVTGDWAPWAQRRWYACGDPWHNLVRRALEGEKKSR
jgi:hypothetical protein